MELIFNNLVITILGLLTIGIIGYWLYRIDKAHPNMKLGEILAAKGVDNNETVFAIVIAGIFLSEAIFAATIHPKDEQQLSPVARFMAHFLISVAGTVASITAVRDIVAIFLPNISATRRFTSTVVALSVLLLSLIVPIINAMLIAGGLDEDVNLQLFLIDWFNSDEVYKKACLYYGLTENYSSWGGMSYAMQATCAATAVHFSLTWIEGWRNINSPTRLRLLIERISAEEEEAAKILKDKAKPKADPEKKKPKADSEPMAAQERHVEKIKDNLTFVLKRIGYSDETLTKQVNSAAARLDSIKESSAKFSMATRLASIVLESKTHDSRNWDDDGEKATNRKKIEKSIYAYFEGPIKEEDPDKKGLGITLKKNSK